MTGNGSRESPPADLLDASVHEELVAFVRALRAAGAAVPSNASVCAAEALSVVGVTDRERTRTGLRAAVLTCADDRDLFDHLFDRFWDRLRDAVLESSESAKDRRDDEGFELPTNEDPTGAEAVDEQLGDTGSSSDSDLLLGEQAGNSSDVYETAQYSPVGASEPVDVPSISREEGIAATVARLTGVLATLAGRRTERDDAGSRPDVRRALRDSVATGGVLTSVPERRRKQTEVRGAVFADVSRSMLDVLNRGFLVEFLRALHQSSRSTRTFLFDTDVREVTDAVGAETPAEMVTALEDAEAAWGGGTRIGHALESVRKSDPDAVERRTVAVVISDGLEMGDLDDLESGMAWLAHRATLVLWLNPLAKSSEYEPTAAGMAAALPYVDCLYPFTDVEDVAALARELELYSPRQVGVRENTGH